MPPSWQAMHKEHRETKEIFITLLVTIGLLGSFKDNKK
jgi:hypothetical protein